MAAPPLAVPPVVVTAPPLPPAEAPPDPGAPSLTGELQENKPKTTNEVSNACLVLARTVTVTVAENLERDTTLDFDIARTVNRNWEKNNP